MLKSKQSRVNGVKLKNSAKKSKTGADGFKISLHPLFFVFGIYYAVTGKIFVFLTYTLSALLHEAGHSYSAHRRGFTLTKLSLMPYGATVSGDFDGLSPLDEFIIAVSGPATSLFIAFLFAGSWWFFPDFYPYTELVYQANLSLCLVNLLPAKPLDGGRILSSGLKMLCGKKISELVVKTTGVILSCFLIFLFALSVIKAPLTANYSLAFFAVFILCGCFTKSDKGAYARIYIGLKEAELIRGVVIRNFAVSEGITVKRLLSLIDPVAYNRVTVIRDGKTLTTLEEAELSALFSNASLYSTLSEVLKGFL